MVLRDDRHQTSHTVHRTVTSSQPKTAVSTSTKDELDNVNERVTSLGKLLVKKEEQIMVLEIKSQLYWRRIYKYKT